MPRKDLVSRGWRACREIRRVLKTRSCRLQEVFVTAGYFECLGNFAPTPLTNRHDKLPALGPLCVAYQEGSGGAGLRFRTRPEAGAASSNQLLPSASASGSGRDFDAALAATDFTPRTNSRRLTHLSIRRSSRSSRSRLLM